MATQIVSSAYIFGTPEEEEKKKKEKQKSILRKSSEIFGKPQVTPLITPPRELFQPTAGMPATIQQKGMVPPSQYKRGSILEKPTVGQVIFL